MAPIARARPMVHEWRGRALGAAARIVLHHPDREAAVRAVRLCVSEIERLEREFSLFLADSALSRLNRDGRLEAPSLDMRRLLEDAQRFGALSRGAFDVTVQPLWQAYAARFAPAAPRGPDRRTIDDALARVDYRAVEIAARRIAFARRGMAITLNGIAQGYITDRVADLLRGHGFEHVLVDVGELRALDDRADGQPWRIALDHPAQRGLTVDVVDAAVATSSGFGSRLNDDAAAHILDPRSGESIDARRGATVIAPTAAAADALATALCVLDAEEQPAMVRSVFGAAAIVSEASGAVRRLGA